MKIFNPLERLIATHTILFGLVVLGILPEEEPQTEATTLGWSLYFIILFVTMMLVIRSWIDYAEHKRNEFRRQNLHHELREVSEVFYLGAEDEPYDWAKEIHDPWAEENPWGEEDPFHDDNEPNQERNK